MFAMQNLSYVTESTQERNPTNVWSVGNSLLTPQHLQNTKKNYKGQKLHGCWEVLHAIQTLCNTVVSHRGEIPEMTGVWEIYFKLRESI